jgi:CHAT domain-containing protein
VQGEAGDTAAARATLTEGRERLRAVGDVVGEAAALAALGDLAALTGATLAAESLYRQGLERLDDRPAADVRWLLHAGLGDALRSRGALGAAAEELEAAVATIEAVADAIRIEERRVGFLADKWGAYASLALVEQHRGRAAEAFRVSERLRARQLRDMLARGRIPSRSEVSEREQDLRRRITELTRAIESAGSDGAGLREPEVTGASVDVAREALAASQNAYEALLLELRESDPAYAELVSGEPVSWEAVADQLGRDEVLLEYLVTDSTSTLFVVTPDTVATVDLDVGRAVLGNLVDFVRRSMDLPGRSPASSLWRTPLRRLHEYLIEPVERAGLLDGKRTLVIVPHGELHFLPFAALMDDASPGRFLVERYELSRAPSATAWVRLAERGRDVPSTGVLALAPSAGSLPASREEVVGIRDVYGQGATILIGESASEQALRDGATRHSILHLATYGVLNKHNPLFSFVELAPDTDGDGRLEVHEVFGLDLEGQLVVLSACQTALASGTIADVPPGDDWVGLVQAFLYAGARGVVASLWPVEDRATAELMQRFYRQLSQGQTESRALAEAQRALLRDGRTAHPFYWAGFVRSGAGS